MTQKEITNEEREYGVSMNVFFTEFRSVKAKSKEEAFERAKGEVNYGMGEEITLFEVELLK
jgi:hypothetical protein